ncbi:MAG: hypothetical protein LBU23_02185 [Planctomycetota bacterium]|jgi:hypothetical protein|nr:hypothetical protein [Planctomycetota bacterium]
MNEALMAGKSKTLFEFSLNRAVKTRDTAPNPTANAEAQPPRKADPLSGAGGENPGYERVGNGKPSGLFSS